MFPYIHCLLLGSHPSSVVNDILIFHFVSIVTTIFPFHVNKELLPVVYLFSSNKSSDDIPSQINVYRSINLYHADHCALILISESNLSLLLLEISFLLVKPVVSLLSDFDVNATISS